MERIVAIYARVSTEHEAQLSALENQIQYYDNILAMHPDWKLYNKYIDEGITGTSIKKRKSFLQMMEDAEKGCFDLIVTREVSRFARNTVDTLQETRRLKRIGIEVYFTEDNIWTMNDEDGELRLTIMATLAQNESKKTSQRVKAGQMISFHNAVPYGTGNIMGYDRVGKEIVINPEQAEVVKSIYKMYMDGLGIRKIKVELERQGILSPMGLSRWNVACISRILRNPFYCGTIVYRKEYTTDYLEQKRKKNKGEVEQIVVEGKHVPIISKDDFQKVQELLDSNVMLVNNHVRGKLRPVYIWSKKLKCGVCGKAFNHRPWTKTPKGGKKYCYQCNTQIEHGTIATRIKRGLSIEGMCDVPVIPEWKLVLMLHMLLKALFEDKKRVLQIANDLLEKNIHKAINKETREKIKYYEGQQNNLKRKYEKLIDMRMGDEVTKEVYLEQREKLEADIADVQDKLTKLKGEDEFTETELQEKVKILEYIMEQDFSFDSKEIPDSIVDLLVKEITVYKDSFKWKLNFFNEEFNCLVDGSAWKPKASLIVSLPQNDNSGTGRYKRTGEIRHKPYYLLTLICTEEDAFDHFSHSSQKYDIRRFDNIVFDVYV